MLLCVVFAVFQEKETQQIVGDTIVTLRRYLCLLLLGVLGVLEFGINALLVLRT